MKHQRPFLSIRWFAGHSIQAIALCVLLVGCALPVIPFRPVYEDLVNYVRLEHDEQVLPEWPPSAHAHPQVMRTEEVAQILAGIEVKVRQTWFQKWMQGEAPLVPVFTSEEIGLLAQQITAALSLAQPDERVTFYLSHPQTSNKRLITTGGLYIQGTELYFTLGNWQGLYGIPTYGMIYDARYPMRAIAAKDFNMYFHLASAVVPHRSSFIDTMLANGDDDLIINLEKVLLQPSGLR